MADERQDRARDGAAPRPPPDAEAFERALFERWQAEGEAADEEPSAFADARILRAAREAKAARDAHAEPIEDGARRPGRQSWLRWSAAASLLLTAALALLLRGPEPPTPGESAAPVPEALTQQPAAPPPSMVTRAPAAPRAAVSGAAPDFAPDAAPDATPVATPEAAAAADAPARLADRAVYAEIAQDHATQNDDASKAAPARALARLTASAARKAFPGAVAPVTELEGRLEQREGRWWLTQDDGSLLLDLSGLPASERARLEADTRVTVRVHVRPDDADPSPASPPAPLRVLRLVPRADPVERRSDGSDRREPGQ